MQAWNGVENFYEISTSWRWANDQNSEFILCVARVCFFTWIAICWRVIIIIIIIIIYFICYTPPPLNLKKALLGHVGLFCSFCTVKQFVNTTELHKRCVCCEFSCRVAVSLLLSTTDATVYCVWLVCLYVTTLHCCFWCQL